MRTDPDANRVALAEEAEANAACRQRMDDYLARTGLRPDDFALRLGYSVSTIRLFMKGIYYNVAGSASRVVKAANEFMDTHPIGGPDEVLGELYDTENVRIIEDTFQKLLQRPVAYMIYAPPGSQKSFVLEHVVARLTRAEIADPDGHRAFYVYGRENIRPRDLVRRVAVACGSRVTNNIDAMISSIRFDFRRNRVVLVIDEAQHLSIGCFETLRELLDQKPYFSLLFAGSHDLKTMFDEFSATLEQWNSRIIAKVRLPGLERTEARTIIEREIGDLLADKTPHQRERLANGLIGKSMTRDAFEKNRAYLNIRTLVNALEQVKAGMSQPHPQMAGSEAR